MGAGGSTVGDRIPEGPTRRWLLEGMAADEIPGFLELLDEEIRDAHAQYGGTYQTGHSEYDSDRASIWRQNMTQIESPE